MAVAPWVLAVAVAAGGVMLLFSGATPSDPERFLWLARYTPIVLIEISHFLSSLIGLVLVLLAFGLRRRLDAAWAASVMLLPVAALLALTQGVRLGGIDDPRRPSSSAWRRSTPPSRAPRG